MINIENIFDILLVERRATITQTQMSKITGMPQAQISQGERLNSHSFNFVSKYAKALGYELQVELVKTGF